MNIIYYLLNCMGTNIFMFSWFKLNFDLKRVILSILFATLAKWMITIEILYIVHWWYGNDFTCFESLYYDYDKLFLTNACLWFIYMLCLLGFYEACLDLIGLSLLGTNTCHGLKLSHNRLFPTCAAIDTHPINPTLSPL